MGAAVAPGPAAGFPSTLRVAIARAATAQAANAQDVTAQAAIAQDVTAQAATVTAEWATIAASR